MVWTHAEKIPRIFYIGRRTLEMVPPGRRRRGRPKQTWVDFVNRDMRAMGTTKYEVHGRTGRRRIVSAVAVIFQSTISFSCQRKAIYRGKINANNVGLFDVIFLVSSREFICMNSRSAVTTADVESDVIIIVYGNHHETSSLNRYVC